MSDLTIFESNCQFREAFLNGLENLLNQSSKDTNLGYFVLVCANVYFDQSLTNTLNSELQIAFDNMQSRYKNLSDNDDRLVFAQIVNHGFTNLQVTQYRQDIKEWCIQFNLIRSFRPRRAAAKQQLSIQEPFNAASFNYTKCRGEGFWNGTLYNINNTYLLYNKFPFAPFHTLIVPELDEQKRQFLEKKYHYWAWKLTQELSKQLTGVGIGYNSLGAFASVNHLHFQMFIDPQGLPVMNNVWEHNGGQKTYPVVCEVFDSESSSWNWITKIHDRNLHSKENVAYNLLYTSDKIYCLARKCQGTYDHENWTSGFAWYEMSGGMITSDPNDFKIIDSNAIQQKFYKLRP